jgi:hypothetical protein
MAFNFPDNPSIGDAVFIGSYKYIWNGSVWEREVVDYQAIVDSIEGVAEDKSFTILTTDTWTDQSGFFTLTKTVNGILDTDDPLIDLDLSTVALANISEIQSQWNSLYRAETGTDTITLYSLEVAPVFPVDITVKVKVIR